MDGNDRLQKRRAFFRENLPELPLTTGQRPALDNTCPSCGLPTLEERGTRETCVVCEWVDTGQDNHDAEEVNRSNGGFSLVQYRVNFQDDLDDGIEEEGSLSTLFNELDRLIASEDEYAFVQALSVVDQIIDKQEGEKM